MTTKNPRVNVTLELPLFNIITTMAKQEHKSVSCLTKELVAQALELREDYYLSHLSEKRIKENTKIISHDTAWK